MYVCTCSPLHTYISERYIILFEYLISVCWQLVSLWADCIGVFIPHDGRPRRARGHSSENCRDRVGCPMYVWMYVCMYVCVCVLKCGRINGIPICPSTFSFYARLISNVCMHVMYSCMHTKKIITTYTVQSKDAQSMQSIEMHKLMR